MCILNLKACLFDHEHDSPFSFGLDPSRSYDYCVPDPFVVTVQLPASTNTAPVAPEISSTGGVIMLAYVGDGAVFPLGLCEGKLLGER